MESCDGKHHFNRDRTIAVKERLYASLIGPLLGLHYPAPAGMGEREFRTALNTSRLKHLWCGVYSGEKVDETIQMYSGIRLPLGYALRLDYDSYEVDMVSTDEGVNTLPPWESCRNAVETGQSNALSAFMYENEPAKQESNEVFRQGLAILLTEVSGKTWLPGE